MPKPSTAHEFVFKLTDDVKIAVSGEIGTVIGRANYTTSEDSYLVRYKAADGRAVEAWWAESALVDGSQFS